MAEHEVVYTFRAVDEISKPMENAKRSLDNADKAGKQYNQTAQKVATESAKASSAVQTLNRDQQGAIIKSIETLTALQAMQSGLSAITNSVQTLGLVDDETAESMKRLTASIQLVVGTAQAVKGIVTLFNTLNGVLKTTAIVSTFAAIAENPAKGALVVGAMGVAAGAIGGYLYSTTNNHSTNITVQHESTARQAEALTDTGTWY